MAPIQTVWNFVDKPLSIRLNSSHGGGAAGDSTVVHESPHHPQTAPDGFSRPSSDEGENEEREDNADKLDCHYSGYHPRPVAVSTHSHSLITSQPTLTDVQIGRIAINTSLRATLVLDLSEP